MIPYLNGITNLISMLEYNIYLLWVSLRYDSSISVVITGNLWIIEWF